MYVYPRMLELVCVYLCILFSIDNKKAYNFARSRNDRNNYVYDIKYITTCTIYYATTSQMVGIA